MAPYSVFYGGAGSPQKVTRKPSQNPATWAYSHTSQAHLFEDSNSLQSGTIKIIPVLMQAADSELHQSLLMLQTINC